jgi:DNA-binding response OmpR family regulator
MRVLIVDDDSTTAELTAECLMMDQSVAVLTAGDGATALGTTAEFKPDVILLDVELPDVSGLDLAPQLKVACREHAPRIIIFSGSAQQANPQNLPHCVDAWLTKPAHLDDLLDCIICPAGAKRRPI